ncbi:Armadillo-type fold [Pseudocohnilembus persalinus]|uniref:Armadillo-type fold n=1 Tax=Pseudocohnilembus persalinus TaxID=266149 RepID=A0A0V0Q950_PSEPJ|nr:Armadillo-type fold [Pseudocohnilembus persalinus]|eukprot:KRW98734.1 Armadillo-type fold [Pseudocohnilembus persalinus]
MFSKTPLERDKKITSTNQQQKIKTQTVAQKQSTQITQPQSLQKKSLLNKPGIKKLPEEETKTQEKTGFTNKPSDKFKNIKCADPFASSKSGQNAGSFMYIYNAGGIPCRVSHGTSKLYLQWNQGVDISQLNYDPILITCFEGLVEQKHPYNFIAYQCAKEMLEDEQSGEKVVPILQKLVWPLRAALGNSNDKVYENALEIAKCLSNSVGPNLNIHIKNLLVPVIRKVQNKKYRDKIYEFLNILEENGGSDVQKTIKASIPTYTNC